MPEPCFPQTSYTCKSAFPDHSCVSIRNYDFYDSLLSTYHNLFIAWNDRSIDCFIVKQFPSLVLETHRTPHSSREADLRLGLCRTTSVMAVDHPLLPGIRMLRLLLLEPRVQLYTLHLPKSRPCCIRFPLLASSSNSLPYWSLMSVHRHRHGGSVTRSRVLHR